MGAAAALVVIVGILAVVFIVALLCTSTTGEIPPTVSVGDPYDVEIGDSHEPDQPSD